MMGYLIIAGLAVATALTVLTVLMKFNILPVIGLGLAIIFGLNPLTYHVGTEIAKDQATTFNEYWNGYETKTVRHDTACHRDGSCSHTYDCDPYTVKVPKTRSVPDGKGGTKNENYFEDETRYHSCPYSKQETDFIIKTTVDDYTVGNNVMTGDQYRWDRAIPGGKVTEAPAAWREAKQRLDAGQPGPVTAVKQYKNFILASQDTLFRTYAENIEDFKAKGLLPKPSNGVYGLYHAKKAYKVGNANVPLFDDYATDVEYLNGAVGDDLHGDLHVVFVPEDIEGGKDDYLNTLTAYWQSEEHGRDAISKNAIIVVIGVATDGKNVSWAKATTGMPLGNEAMLTQISSDLQGEALDAKLIGRPTFNVANKEVVSSSGALENILWGDNTFQRVSMSGGNEDDNGSGYKYLRDELQPKPWEVFWIGFVNFLIAGGLVTGFVLLVVNEVIPTKFARWKGTRSEEENYYPYTRHRRY
jgi:hypothetical protein